MKRALLILFSCFISFFPLFAIDDIHLHLKVVQQKEASKPEFYFGQILFSAEPEKNTRHVGIAFAHENFQEIHSYQKNENGVFFLIMDIPNEPYLEYRLIVDGIWQVDPMAEMQVEGINGFSFSRLNIPEDFRPKSPSPEIKKEGLVVFTLNERPGNAVYLAGDFNHWDPYMLPMTEIEPGIYKASVKMTPGTHYYNFYINGKTQKDPLNREIRLNQYGEEQSVLFIP